MPKPSDGKSIAGWSPGASDCALRYEGIRDDNKFVMTRVMTRVVTMLTALAFAVPALCSGQDLLGSTRLEIDRVELTRFLAQYDAVAQSTAYSDVLRDEGRARADLIRERLRTGDFRTGDQIALFIEGGVAVQWDTLTVAAGPLIDVPTLGPILLEGVLRSELETHLGTELGRFIRSPRVRARALIRISIMGVGEPGFRMMPTDVPLSEAVMLAGGPGPGVDPGQIRVERGQDVLWSVDDLLAPVAEGRTLDELGLQPGDRIMLREGSAPGAGVGGITQSLISAVLITLPLVLITAAIR